MPTKKQSNGSVNKIETLVLSPMLSLLLLTNWWSAFIDIIGRMFIKIIDIQQTDGLVILTQCVFNLEYLCIVVIS